MMTWAALPPAQTDCLASKPITLCGSSLSLGVTGQTTRTHTHTQIRGRWLNRSTNHFSRPLPDISSSVLLTVWIVSLLCLLLGDQIHIWHVPSLQKLDAHIWFEPWQRYVLPAGADTEIHLGIKKKQRNTDHTHQSQRPQHMNSRALEWKRASGVTLRVVSHSDRQCRVSVSGFSFYLLCLLLLSLTASAMFSVTLKHYRDERRDDFHAFMLKTRQSQRGAMVLFQFAELISPSGLAQRYDSVCAALHCWNWTHNGDTFKQKSSRRQLHLSIQYTAELNWIELVLL